MVNRKIIGGVVCLFAIVALVSPLALHEPYTEPVVRTVTIGAPLGMLNTEPAIDEQASRAFILDDGNVNPRVVARGNTGYLWTSTRTRNVVHVVNTETGSLLKAINVPPTARSMAVDFYTDRLFVFAQGQIMVIAARSGKVVGRLQYNGDPFVIAALADAQSGHLFVTTGLLSGFTHQSMLVLDGHTGSIQRTITFSLNGLSARQYISPLSMALDGRGHLYVFSSDRQMRTIDTRTGNVLAMRRLSHAFKGVTLNEQAGRLFAFTVPPSVSSGGSLGRKLGTLAMLDAKSGKILRTMLAGTTFSGKSGIVLDTHIDRVLVTNELSNTVSVLDGTSGKLVRTVPVSAVPRQIVLDSHRHHAIVALDGGSRIAVLDIRSATLLRTINLRYPIVSMAVDEETNHLLAVISAISRPIDSWGWLPSWLRSHLPGIPPPPSQRIMNNDVIVVGLPK